LDTEEFQSKHFLSLVLKNLLLRWDTTKATEQGKRVRAFKISAENMLKYGKMLLSAGASPTVKIGKMQEPLLLYLLTPFANKNYKDNLRLDFAQMVLEFTPNTVIKEYSKCYRTCLVDKILDLESPYDRESQLRFCPVLDLSTVSHEKIVKLVKAIIAKGAKEPECSDDDDGSDSKYYSWLHLILSNISRDPGFELLDAVMSSCRVNAVAHNEMSDYDEDTPLQRCVRANNLILTKKLIAAGAESNIESRGNLPIIEAALKLSDGEMFKILLDAAGAHVADALCTDHNQNNLLHIVSANKNFWKSKAFDPAKVFHKLVELGVDINARNNSCYRLGTPLMLCLITKELGDDTVVKHLLKANCDLSSTYEFACEKMRHHDISSLSFIGVPFKLDWCNVTALEYCLLKGMVSTAYIILSAGSPYNSETIEKILPSLKAFKTPGGKEIDPLSDKDREVHLEYISMIEKVISNPKSLKNLTCSAIQSSTNPGPGGDAKVSTKMVEKLNLPSQLKKDVTSNDTKGIDELPTVSYEPRFMDRSELKIQMEEAGHFWATFIEDQIRAEESQWQYEDGDEDSDDEELDSDDEEARAFIGNMQRNMSPAQFLHMQRMFASNFGFY